MPLTELHSHAASGTVRAQVPFLVTKIVPPRSAGLIDRPRLMAAATRLPSKRLAVIRAPAGFGKTSLAAIWAEWLGQRGSTGAWFTIDPEDDDPPRFLFYMVQAIQRCAREVGATAIELINEALLINPHSIVSTLINDLTDIDGEVYLFLEDYHWVADPVIHEALAFFLKHAPSHAHVVLTTRTEPPLPLASLRANNQLLEVDAAELRFDLQEIHVRETWRLGGGGCAAPAFKNRGLARSAEDHRRHASLRTGLLATHDRSLRGAASNRLLPRRNACGSATRIGPLHAAYFDPRPAFGAALPGRVG
jgi:hypothetical protein